MPFNPSRKPTSSGDVVSGIMGDIQKKQTFDNAVKKSVGVPTPKKPMGKPGDPGYFRNRK